MLIAYIYTHLHDVFAILSASNKWVDMQMSIASKQADDQLRINHKTPVTPTSSIVARGRTQIAQRAKRIPSKAETGG